MSNYLIQHYKGIYRLKSPIDLLTNSFPREYNGKFADNDIYIDCYNNIQIYVYGHGILEAYIPSLQKGRNIIKSIKNDLGNDIIFHIIETDAEVIFRFKNDKMKKLEKYLKPKTNGARISPFSVRNIKTKTKYKITDED